MDGKTEFRLLGPLEVWSGGQAVVVGGHRQRELLTVLLLKANQAVSVDSLVELAWPGQPPGTARRQVQNAVGRLRRALVAGGIPETVIETLPGGYRLWVDEDRFDVLVFGRLAAAGRRVEGDLAQAAGLFRNALALWRGPMVVESDAEFIVREAARLEEERLSVLEACLDMELRLGRHHELVGELTTLVDQYPLRERLLSLLMVALYRDGRKAEALTVYRQARMDFIAELGLEPGQELRALEHAVLTEAAELDIEPQSDPAKAARPCWLPPDIADFVGREGAVADLERRLGGSQANAVTVVAIAGKGGIGKTALAVHVAHRVRDAYPGGQLYVNLRAGDHPAEPAEVLARFLRTLGVDGATIPDGLEERTELYRERVAGRRLLVVLDNAVDEAQVQPLVPGAPRCAVLVTCRSRLAGLPGAHLVELGELEPGPAEDLLRWIVGEPRIKAEQAAVGELLRLTGRLPLALRIVGARLAVRPHWRLARLVEHLADERRRLDELVHGEHEVRTSLALSYRDLDPRSRRLFHLLGILRAPSFASWVCAALLGCTETEADELLDDLIAAQLVDLAGRDATGEMRYRMHDLVRLYAWERSQAHEQPVVREAAVVRALGGWLAMVEVAHRAIHGGDFMILHGSAPRWPLPARLAATIESDPLTWYETERLNIVAGVGQAAEAGLDELCWDLAATAVSQFLSRGHNDEWETCLNRALEATRAAGNRRGAAAMLTGLGLLGAYRHRYADAETALDEALRLFRELDDPHGLALVLPLISHNNGMRGRYHEAVRHLAQAVPELTRVGDRGAQAITLRSLGQMLLDIGNSEQARPYLEQALIVSRRGHPRTRAEVLFRLGEIYLSDAELNSAEALFEEVRDLAELNDDPRTWADAYHGIGLVRLAAGALPDAVELLEKATALNQQSGDLMMEGRARLDFGESLRRSARYGEAIAQLEQAVRLCEALPLWRARALNALGDVLADLHGNTDQAARKAWHQAHELFNEVRSAEADDVAAKLAHEHVRPDAAEPEDHPRETAP